MTAISVRQYRWLDRGTKLLGVALLALAFDGGIATAPGIGLAVAGVLLGVSTAFLTEDSA